MPSADEIPLDSIVPLGAARGEILQRPAINPGVRNDNQNIVSGGQRREKQANRLHDASVATGLNGVANPEGPKQEEPSAVNTAIPRTPARIDRSSLV